MRKKQILRMLPVIFTLSSALAQTPAERLEQGVQLQSGKKDLQGAIAEYQAVLKATKKSQSLASEARYRLAECYSMLGDTEQMSLHLKALREDFPEDNKWVLKAVASGLPVGVLVGAPWQDNTLYTYDVKKPSHGDPFGPASSESPVGKLYLATRLVEESPNVWESTSVLMSQDENRLTRAVFQEADYQLVSARTQINPNYASQHSDEVIVSLEKGKTVTMTNPSIDRETGHYDHAESFDAKRPLFEASQGVQLLRALRQEIGTKFMAVYLPESGDPEKLPSRLAFEVVSYEEIEVPAGKFTCAKITSTLDSKPYETYFVSRGKNRELVRIQFGEGTTDLAQIEQWDRQSSREVKFGTMDAKMTLSGKMFSRVFGEKHDKDGWGGCYLNLWSSDFVGGLAMMSVIKNLPTVGKDGQIAQMKTSREMVEGIIKKPGPMTRPKLIGEMEEFEVDGVKAVGAKIEYTTWDQNFPSKIRSPKSYVYEVCAVGKEATMTFRNSYLKEDEEKAIAQAKEILKSFRW